MKFKKGISHLISISLITLISILVTLNFQIFVQTYTSSNNNDIELKSNSFFNNLIKIEALSENFLYIKTNSNQKITFFQIKKKGSSSPSCSFDINSIVTFSNKTKLLLTFDSKSIVNGVNLSDFSYQNLVFELIDQNFSNIDSNTPPKLSDECIKNECFELDGIDDLIYSKKAPFIRDLNSSFTGNMWFKVNNLTNQNINIWEQSWDSFDLEFSSSKNLYGRIRNSSGFLFHTVDYNNFSFLDWIFVSLVYNKNDGRFSFYVNGELISITDVSDFNYFYSSNPSLTIGSRDIITNAPHFNGTVDEMSFYSEALNKNEVNALFEMREAMFYEQILSKGTNKMDISNCKLKKGDIYDVLIFLDSNQKIESELIVK